MNRLLFTKISALIGLVLGLVSAHNIGVIIITEYIGYSLPFLVTGAVIGLVFDGIQTLSTLNRQLKGTQNQGSNDGLAVKPNPSEPKKTDIRFALAMFIACVFGGLFVTGWVKVVVGLGVAPLETIAGQIGVALIPFVVGWLIAKVLGIALKKVSFNTLWVASTTLLIVLMFVGQNKSETSVATSHDTTIQPKVEITVADSDDLATCINTVNYKQWIKALPACTKAAERGDPIAQYNLGMIYGLGHGVAKNYTQAERWWRLAAAQDLAYAQNNLGALYGNGHGVAKDYAQAVRWYRLAADQGLADAQYNLGAMYGNGHGVTQDYEEEVRWYRLAAEQGLADAQYNLGQRYGKGQGVVQDYKEAVRWYTLAAEQGLADAQYNLGVMYSEGQGVAQDYVRAHMWFDLAAVAGDADSVNGRDIAASYITQEQIAQAQQMARDCVAKNYKGC